MLPLNKTDTNIMSGGDVTGEAARNVKLLKKCNMKLGTYTDEKQHGLLIGMYRIRIPVSGKIPLSGSIRYPVKFDRIFIG